MHRRWPDSDQDWESADPGFWALRLIVRPPDGRRFWGARRLADMEGWRRHVTRIPYDEAVATTWGSLDARAQARGRPRPINDMWIAACCLVEDVPLATLNRKDFDDFAEHDGLRVIGINER